MACRMRHPHIFNAGELLDEMITVILLVHKKFWDNDRVNKRSFTIVADHLMTDSPRKRFFQKPYFICNVSYVIRTEISVKRLFCITIRGLTAIFASKKGEVAQEEAH